MTEPWVGPRDVVWAARACRAALEPALERDWGVKAGDLAWDCRRTLDHVVDTLFLYAAYLASRATERVTPPRNGDPGSPPAALLGSVEAAAAVLAEVGRAAPEGTRAFHPAGAADVSGWMAMGCEEIVMHTHDIAQALGLPFRPPDDLAARVLTRLFPWAPTDGDVWAALCWATGRNALPDRKRLGPDWYWHCAPLAEWDGTRKVRTAPPAWT